MLLPGALGLAYLILALSSVAGCDGASGLAGGGASGGGKSADKDDEPEPPVDDDIATDDDENEKAGKPVMVAGAFLTCSPDVAVVAKVADGSSPYGCGFFEEDGKKQAKQLPILGVKARVGDAEPEPLICVPAGMASRWQVACGVPVAQVALLKALVVTFEGSGGKETAEVTLEAPEKTEEAPRPPPPGFSLHAVPLADLDSVLAFDLSCAQLGQGTAVFESATVCHRWCTANAAGVGRMVDCKADGGGVEQGTCLCATNVGGASQKLIELALRDDADFKNCDQANGKGLVGGAYRSGSICHFECAAAGAVSGFATECNSVDSVLGCTCVAKPPGGAVSQPELPVVDLDAKVGGQLSGNCTSIHLGAKTFVGVQACQAHCAATGFVGGWLHDCVGATGIGGCSCVK